MQQKRQEREKSAKKQKELDARKQDKLVRVAGAIELILTIVSMIEVESGTSHADRQKQQGADRKAGEETRDGMGLISTIRYCV